MADQLATPAELALVLQRVLDADTADLLLDMATARVQRAASGQRILAATSTAVIDVDPAAYGDCYLELPQHPVRSVSAVTLDGVAITDWRLSSQMLWRRSGWCALAYEPSQVTVASAHGYLVGDQALELARDATLSLAQLGYGNPDLVKSESIDDYRVTYADADARMQMTEHMRMALADAYGRSAYSTGFR